MEPNTSDSAQHSESKIRNGEALIKLEGIIKVFFTDEVETHALSGIHLEIKRGEYVSIAGPSGCGKSTMLSILGLLDTPTEGTYILNGNSVAHIDMAERARIRNREVGFIFQSFNLIGDLTVYENVELPLMYNGLHGGERRERARESLRLVGLEERLHHTPNQLSGGQQQRVAIARALINRPALILADEPTGNLDSKTSMEILELFQKLNATERITVVLVTHEADIAAYAQRQIHFRDGHVISDQPTAGRSKPFLGMNR